MTNLANYHGSTGAVDFLVILINIVNMTNKSITATKAKTEFALLVDEARREPITITRNNRPVAVILSPEEYQRLYSLEDAYWGNRAIRAETKGQFLSNKESLEFLNS